MCFGRAGGADQHVAWQRFQAYTISHFGQIYARTVWTSNALSNPQWTRTRVFLMNQKLTEARITIESKYNNYDNMTIWSGDSALKKCCLKDFPIVCDSREECWRHPSLSVVDPTKRSQSTRQSAITPIKAGRTNLSRPRDSQFAMDISSISGGMNN